MSERDRPMAFPDLSKAPTRRVRYLLCRGGPECRCKQTRVYPLREERLEVECELDEPAAK